MKTIKPIILAGGKSKRMKSDKPKVLIELRGEPMIGHLLKAVGQSGFAEPAVIVIGHAGEEVKEALGPKYKYAVQEKQLGTGHAVATAIPYVLSDTRHIMVLYGDHPLVSKETMENLAKTHLKEKNPITMCTVSIPDFNGSRSCFLNFSRVIRNKEGVIIGNVEFKDATEDQKKITEVNPCYFCFNVDWLAKNIKKIANKNAQGEYYLTDLIKIACENGDKIGDIKIPPRDAMGANTLEQLSILDELLG